MRVVSLCSLPFIKPLTHSLGPYGSREGVFCIAFTSYYFLWYYYCNVAIVVLILCFNVSSLKFHGILSPWSGSSIITKIYIFAKS